jgi:2-dehydro-3-deoxyphosphogluconate aldolase/(4S)-4-hydroxy-2-oxoglutarate aldolase
MNDTDDRTPLNFDDAVRAVPVIPVIVLQRGEDAAPVAEALIAGGIPIFEVTLRTAAALPAIAELSKKFPDALTGAGTVLDRSQCEQAIAAGASFIVSPGWDEGVVETAQRAGLPVVPGVATASEVQRARNRGLRVLKLFPAGIAGGVPMLRALAGVYQDVGFVPTGGVSAGNLADYLAVPNVVAVGGSWLTPKQAVAEGRFDEITRLAREARQIAAETRQPDGPR